LLAMMSFAELVNELSRVGEGGYGLTQAGEYVLLSIPRTAYDLFPSAALLGSLLGLGLLAGNRELIVIRAAGVSLARLVWSVMKVGLLLMITAVVLGEYVAPVSEKFAQVLRTQSLTNQVTLNSKTGLWVRDKQNFINIRTVLLDGHVGDVTIYRFDGSHNLYSTIHARSAAYQDNQWVLRDVSRKRIGPDGVTVTHEDRAVWQSLFNPELFNVVSVAPEDLSTRGLYQYITYLHDNGLSARRYELAFWQKLLWPVATGVMLLISMPFVLGPRRLASMGQRILVGVLLGLGFRLVNEAAGQSALVYHLDLGLFSALPVLVFLAAALFLLYKAR
jgi:lipopolysaccharide export system permease protein